MIDHTEVGCWIVKADPKTWDYFRALAEDQTPPIKPHLYPGAWTLGRTYRNGMIRKGDLIALWVTGTKNPGIHEFGTVTDEPYEVDGFDAGYALDQQRAREKALAIEYSAVRLYDNFVPRPEMKADPVLCRCEQFRAPQASNPSYLDPDETKALAHLIAARVPMARLRDAKWGRALR
ncbi:EVE domain-containing protein [Terrabacter sp. NPDC080008]|uniref:EVE domain-containing protein n=1 Tax=Terrabacter sp. NPDC080008 TaxID=3155176 RepID=UPI00344ED623